MRAVVVKKTGPPDLLESVSDWPLPELQDGEVVWLLISLVHLGSMCGGFTPHRKDKAGKKKV